MANSNGCSNTLSCSGLRLPACPPGRCVWGSLVHSPCLSAAAAPLHLMNSYLLSRPASFLDFRNSMSSYHCLIPEGRKAASDYRLVISALCAFLRPCGSCRWSSWLVCGLELLQQLHLDPWCLAYCSYAHYHHAFYGTPIHRDYHCSADPAVPK